MVGYPVATFFSNLTLSVNDKIYKILSLFLQGEGGTMRNSRGEIDNLVQCQLFVLNLYLQGCLPPRENLMVGCPFYSTI